MKSYSLSNALIYLFSIFFLIVVSSFEAFWVYFFGYFGGPLSVFLALVVAFSFWFFYGSFKTKAREKKLFLFFFIHHIFVSCYFISFALIQGLESDRSFFGVFSFYVISYLCPLLTFFWKPRFNFFEGEFSPFVLNFIIMVFSAFVVVLNYYVGGGKHGIFNQNWLMLSAVFLTLIAVLLSGGVIERYFSCFVLIGALSLVFGSLGVFFVSFLAMLMICFRSYSVFLAFSFLVPIVSLFLLVFVFEFDFFSINAIVSELLGSSNDIDYSSNRFLSWDLILDGLRAENLKFYFGYGMHEVSSVFFADGGVKSTAHNLWFETIFRVGIVGWFLIFFPFMVIYFFIDKNSKYRNFYAFSLSIFLGLGQFYDIGGFTHHSGTIFMKILMISIFIVSKRVQDNGAGTALTKSSSLNPVFK